MKPQTELGDIGLSVPVGRRSRGRLATILVATKNIFIFFLSQPQLNLNSTQKLGLTQKLLKTTTHPHKLNVINIATLGSILDSQLS